MNSTFYEFIKEELNEIFSVRAWNGDDS